MAGPKNRKKLNKDLVTYNGKRMSSETAVDRQMQASVSRGEAEGTFRDFLYNKGISEDLTAGQIDRLYRQYVEQKNMKFMN